MPGHWRLPPAIALGLSVGSGFAVGDRPSPNLPTVPYCELRHQHTGRTIVYARLLFASTAATIPTVPPGCTTS